MFEYDYQLYMNFGICVGIGGFAVSCGPQNLVNDIFPAQALPVNSWGMGSLEALRSNFS